MSESHRILKGIHVERTFLYMPPGKLRLNEESAQEVSSLLAQERLIAYQKGKEEGEREGYLKAHHEVDALVILFQALSKKILEERQELIQTLKEEILSFCVEVCRKFLQESLQNPEILTDMIERLIAKAQEAFEGQAITIHLSLEDKQLLERYEEKARKREKREWKCIVDPLLKPGDVRLEAKSGLINCLIERELEDLMNQIQYPLSHV